MKAASLHRTLLALMLVASSWLSPGNASAQTIELEKQRGAFPHLFLDKELLGGTEAVQRLGSRIGSVASWYNLTGERLKSALLNDSSLRIDRNGRLLFMEKPYFASQAGGASEPILDGNLVDLALTFKLHSRPAASRTIYLDFDGGIIDGTVWNKNRVPINAAPYDLDGNPGTFSTLELQRIQNIWQRVAEDYAPFDVNITTELPSPDKLSRSNSSDQTFGTTVVITKTTGVYSCSCGGVAYVGVFNATDGTYSSGYYKPALVFYDMLGAGAEKPVAEAISHEAGHNVGLRHDGTSSAAYYSGQGSDPVVGWAPIMGIGYYKPLVQFSRGEYASANNKEDDFSIVQSFGLPLRQDDFGDAIGSARPLAFPVSGMYAGGSIDGVIETYLDKDLFAVSPSAGPLTAQVEPASRSPNADLVLSLLDGQGRVVASANPLNALNAKLTFTVPSSGTYFLEIRSTGQGDPATTGYSNYGSVGNYRLVVSYPASSGQPPTAVLTSSVTTGEAPLAVSFSGVQSQDDGGIVSWRWEFGDGSSDQTGVNSSVSHLYQTPGTYRARLTVADNTGLTASAEQTVVVTSPAPEVTLRDPRITLVKDRKGFAWATVTATVIDNRGAAIPGARVQGEWSGLVRKTASARADRGGSVTLTSPKSKTRGCFTLSVNSIVARGYAFKSGKLSGLQVCN